MTVSVPQLKWLAASLLLALMVPGCSEKTDGPTQVPSQVAAAETSIDAVIQETLNEARQAIDLHGVSEAAMPRIKAALQKLAQASGLKEHSELREIHGGGVASAVLRSESDQGLTLILARFSPGMTTPIHDHGSWAVAYVVEGQERYTQWERRDDGSDPDHAELGVKYERVLGPGDSVHWFNPPHDIHSQEALEGYTWELILFGSNPLHGTLHYFDPSTGQVTAREPVATNGSAEQRSSEP